MVHPVGDLAPELAGQAGHALGLFESPGRQRLLVLLKGLGVHFGDGRLKTGFGSFISRQQ